MDPTVGVRQRLNKGGDSDLRRNPRRVLSDPCSTWSETYRYVMNFSNLIVCHTNSMTVPGLLCLSGQGRVSTSSEGSLHERQTKYLSHS